MKFLNNNINIALFWSQNSKMIKHKESMNKLLSYGNKVNFQKKISILFSYKGKD